MAQLAVKYKRLGKINIIQFEIICYRVSRMFATDIKPRWAVLLILLCKKVLPVLFSGGELGLCNYLLQKTPLAQTHLRSFKFGDLAGKKKMKWYYYLYYKIFNAAKSISDDVLNEWKPLIIISALEIFIFIQAIIWYSVLTKNIYRGSNIYFFLLSIALVSFNYYIFIYNHKWKQYIQSFKKISKKKDIWNGIIILFGILGILGTMIFAFYQMSLIDWAKYR